MAQNMTSSSTSILARGFLSSSFTVASLSSSYSASMKHKRVVDEINEKKVIKLEDIHKEDEYSKSLLPPTYEILCLLGQYMDLETLAIASCVSKTWSQCFSQESLWKHVLTSRSSNLFYNLEVAKETMERFSYKRFVSVVERDAKRRRKKQPEEPKISLSDLMFILHVSTSTSTPKAFYKKGKDLKVVDFSGKFQVEIDVRNSGVTSGTPDVRLMMQVVYKDWEKLITIVDTTKSSLHAKYGWFTDELPVKERSFCSAGSKLVGDVKTIFNGGELEKIGFAIANSSKDYESLYVDDVLRYLQGFFVV